MAAATSKAYLDAAFESESEKEHGYDSDAAEDSRAQRAPKRRRISVESDDEDLSDGVDVIEEEAADTPDQPETVFRSSKQTLRNSTSLLDRASAIEAEEAKATDDLQNKVKASKSRKRELIDPASAHKVPSSKTGVMYISRIPPFMKPTTLRHFLAPHAPQGLGRLFLTPEDPVSHRQRTRSGGNKKRSFTDGWVEFLSKKEARHCVENLNTQIIGGKKGGWYHDDVWNLRYLKGFKWHNLTETIANENAERASRMRAEIAQTNRENKRFLANVDRAKRLQGMEEKRRLKEQRKKEASGGEAEDVRVSQKAVPKGFPRHFRQNEVLRNTTAQNDAAEQPPEVQRVLSKIF
ncbi:MAG: RNA-binding ATPase activator esf2 [Chrysothrix sp. TS-e1954]|nr:MAG: RNA-binding ATPase activator esf2 [Chrysothrix sp. TS-e1954]